MHTKALLFFTLKFVIIKNNVELPVRKRSNGLHYLINGPNCKWNEKFFIPNDLDWFMHFRLEICISRAFSFISIKFATTTAMQQQQQAHPSNDRICLAAAHVSPPYKLHEIINAKMKRWSEENGKNIDHAKLRAAVIVEIETESLMVCSNGDYSGWSHCGRHSGSSTASYNLYSLIENQFCDELMWPGEKRLWTRVWKRAHFKWRCQIDAEKIACKLKTKKKYDNERWQPRTLGVTKLGPRIHFPFDIRIGWTKLAQTQRIHGEG